MNLHPGFAASWPALREMISRQHAPGTVVTAAPVTSPGQGGDQAGPASQPAETGPGAAPLVSSGLAGALAGQPGNWGLVSLVRDVTEPQPMVASARDLNLVRLLRTNSGTGGEREEARRRAEAGLQAALVNAQAGPPERLAGQDLAILGRLWDASEWERRDEGRPGGYWLNEHQVYALVLAVRTGLEYEPGVREEIRRLLGSADWAARYPLGDEAQFSQILREVVDYYQGDDMFVMSNYDLDRLDPQDWGRTVRESLLSAYPGRITTGEEHSAGRVTPVRGHEVAAIGYTAMMQPPGPDLWWQSTEPHAHPKFALLASKYRGSSMWYYGAYTFKWDRARLAGRMTVTDSFPKTPLFGGADAVPSAVMPEHLLWALYRAMRQDLGEQMRAAFAFATGFRFDPQMRGARHGGGVTPRWLLVHVHGELDLRFLDELIIHWSPDRTRVSKRRRPVYLPGLAQAMRVQQDFLRFKHEHGLGYRVVLRKYGDLIRDQYDYPELYVVLRGHTVQGLLDGSERLLQELAGRVGRPGPQALGPGDVVVRVAAGRGSTAQSAADFRAGVVRLPRAAWTQVTVTRFYSPAAGGLWFEETGSRVPLAYLAGGMMQLRELTPLAPQPAGGAGRHYTGPGRRPWYWVAAKSSLAAQSMVLLAGLRRAAGEEGLPEVRLIYDDAGKVGVGIQDEDPGGLAGELGSGRVTEVPVRLLTDDQVRRLAGYTGEEIGQLVREYVSSPHWAEVFTDDLRHRRDAVTGRRRPLPDSPAVLAGLRREDALELAQVVQAEGAAGLAGAGPLSLAGLEPLLEGLFGARPPAEADLADRRLRALAWLVELWVDGGDPAGVVSVAGLAGLAGVLLGEAVAPAEVVAGVERLRELAAVVLPGARLRRSEWLDLAGAVSAARAGLGQAPGAGVSAGELTGYVRALTGQGGAVTPVLLAAVAQARGLLGRAPADAGEALYVGRLVLLARGVYGGLAVERRPGAVVWPLAMLAGFFGWEAGARVPGRFLPADGEPGRFLPGRGELVEWFAAWLGPEGLAIAGAWAVRRLREQVAGLLGLPAGEVMAAEVDAAARAVGWYARETGGLPGSRAVLEEFARGVLPPVLQAGPSPVRELGRVLQLADEMGELAGDPDGWRRWYRPSLVVAAQVAVLAAGQAGPGGAGGVPRPGLGSLLERLFGARPAAGAGWRSGADPRLEALLWLVEFWLEGVAGGVVSVPGLAGLAGRLLGQDAGGQDPLRVFAHVYGLAGGAGLERWLTPAGVGDVVVAVSAAAGDLGAGLTGLTVAGPGGQPDPASDVAAYLRVLTGGGDGGPGAGPADGQRAGLADLLVVASWLRAGRGLAPGAALEPGELAALVRRRAGEDGGQDGALAPGALPAAARGLREEAAGLLGLPAEQVTAQQADAAGRAVAGYRRATGRSPESGQELAGFAGPALAAAGTQRPRGRGDGAAGVGDAGPGGPGGAGGGVAGVIVAYGQWLRFAAELAAGLAGPGGVLDAAVPGLDVVVGVAGLAREAAGLGGGAGPVSLGGLEPLLERLFGPRRPDLADLRLRALLGLAGWELQRQRPGGGAGRLRMAGLGAPVVRLPELGLAGMESRRQRESGEAGQLTAGLLAGRVAQLLGQFGNAPQGPVARGEDPRMGQLLRWLGRQLERQPAGSHAAMLGKTQAEHQRELGAGARGRLARARVPDLEGKLAPPAGSRAAVLRVLTPAQHQLIHGRDRRAGSLAPGEALAERDWAHLRGDGRGLRVPWRADDPPFEGEGAFTARRFTVAAGDGRQVTVTEATVTVRLVPDPGLSEQEVELAKARLLDQVDEVANHQHVLKDGSQFHYRIVFTGDPGPAQQVVQLHAGDGSGPGEPISSGDFYLDMLGSAWAHEALHFLGLDDWYEAPYQPGIVYRKQAVSPGVRHDSAVMSTPGVRWADETSLQLKPGPGGGPLGVGLWYGLKDVDLAHIDGLIERAEEEAGAEVPEPGGAREREPGEVVFAVAGPPQLADVQVPERVSRMLELFSSEERTLEQALLLDYARVLAGELTDAAKARHAVGLVLLAGDVYGGIPFYPPRRRVDRPLMALVALFGRVSGAAAPERYLPGHGKLRELVAGLLGLAEGTPVSAAYVDAAARAVGQYLQHKQQENAPLPVSPEELDRELAAFARGRLPRLLTSKPSPVRAYGQLLQFAAEINETQGRRRPPHDGRARGRAGPGGRGAGRPGRAVVPARSGSAADPDLRPPAEQDDPRMRISGLYFLVGLSLDDGDPAGPVSVASLDGLTEALLGGTVAPPEVLAGIRRMSRLAAAVLPVARLNRQGWLDLAEVASALRAAWGLAPGAEVAPGEFANFVHELLGEDPGQGAALTPERLAAAARWLRSRHGLARVRGLADAAAAAAAGAMGGAAAGGPAVGETGQEYCLAVVGHLAGLLFPGGIVSGQVRDDGLAGAGRGARRYLGVLAVLWGPVAGGRS